jgi:hypothetical protein
MTRTKVFASIALAGLLLSTSALSPVGPLSATPAQAQSVNVSFDLFFDELEPHGVWVRHPQYRYVFCPTGVDTSWRPYTRGRWLYLADQGWYFASDEPFGWATYHYGRWLDDDNLGWCWVPGNKWAPAWVSWRRGGNAIGWAPLPPEREGFSVSLEVVREDFPEDYWIFVPTRSFIEPDLSVSIVFGSDARDYYRETEFLGPVVVQGDVVTNNVIEVNYIEQQINQEVTIYNVEESSDPATASVSGETVQIFNQDIEEPTEEAAPAEAVDEAEAAEVIATEGGTAGTDATAEEDTDTDPEATETETEITDPDATTTEATDEETTEPDATTTDTETETEVTTEEEDPAVTTETVTETETEVEQPTTTEEETTEDATPAADETEQPADATEAETETTDEATTPADADAEQTEESAPAEDDAATPDCPPELLVDGVCQPAGETTESETSTDESTDTGESFDSETDADAGGGEETATE